MQASSGDVGAFRGSKRDETGLIGLILSVTGKVDVV